MFYWVVKASAITFGFLGALWALMTIAIGDRWKLSVNILIGDGAPNNVKGVGYAAALVIAAMGYFIVPAFIGAVVSVVVSVVAVRSVSRKEAARAWRKYGPISDVEQAEGSRPAEGPEPSAPSA